MAKFGAHSFLWIDQWTTEKGNYAINAAAEMGFDYVELHLLQPFEFEGEIHKKVLRDAGIEAVASLGLPEELHMPENPECAKKFLYKALQKLQDAGSTYLCGCIAYTIGKFSGQPPIKAERQIVHGHAR